MFFLFCYENATFYMNEDRFNKEILKGSFNKTLIPMMEDGVSYHQQISFRVMSRILVDAYFQSLIRDKSVKNLKDSIFSGIDCLVS